MIEIKYCPNEIKINGKLQKCRIPMDAFKDGKKIRWVCPQCAHRVDE